MTDVPVRKLGDLVSIVGGGTPSKSVETYWDGDIPWVSPKDMKSRVVTDTQDHLTTEAIACTAAVRVVPKDSVLVVVRSGILARYVPISLAGRELTVNQDMKALIPGDDVTGQYVFYYLRYRATEILASGVKRGATVHSLNTAALRDLEVPVPTLDEQQRLVRVFERADRSRDLAHALVARLETVLDALLSKAFGESAGTGSDTSA